MLAVQPGKFSLTTDLWTSGNGKAFASLTVAFIDSEWQLQEFLLDFVHLTGRHTGENIARALFQTLETYGIERRVSRNCMSLVGYFW